MRLSTSSLIAPACASILALALSACGGSQSNALPGSGAGMVVQNDASGPLKSTTPGPLKTKPTKLNFTTAPTLKLTVSESKYSGKFKIAVSPAHLIKISPAKSKGPSGKLTITALNAGAGKITITDDHGGKKTVPFTVTQGVIIIQ